MCFWSEVTVTPIVCEAVINRQHTNGRLVWESYYTVVLTLLLLIYGGWGGFIVVGIFASLWWAWGCLLCSKLFSLTYSRLCSRSQDSNMFSLICGLLG